MQNVVIKDVTAAVAKNRRKSIWKRIVSVLACIVVFCTTYALILPALTLERTPECGLEEHTHTEACYIKDEANAKQALMCDAETLALHQHTPACFDIDGRCICGYSDFVLHSHNEFCFDENGVLVCTLPEISAHIHADDCYIMSDPAAELSGEIDGIFDNPVDGSIDGPIDGSFGTGLDGMPTDILGHIHTDDCYATERGELICTLPEEPAHVHTDECYLNTDELTCPLTEGEGHLHGEGCFDEAGALICTLPESAGHTHTPECYQSGSTLVCTLGEGEQAHVHTDECYAMNEVLVCGIQDEPSVAGDGSAMPFPESEEWPAEISPKNDIYNVDGETDDRGEPVCGIPEIIPHCHDASCFDVSGAVICGMPEVLEHIHTQDCMGTLDDSDELTCTIAEGEGAHFHTVEAGCFDEEGNLVCELEESEGHIHGTICYGNWILVCEIEEHTHTDECYPSTEPEADSAREAFCGKEEHTHEGECIDANGVVVCGVEEHTHTEECYVNPLAEREAFCGKEEHKHAAECVDANGVISCGVEEHQHVDECYLERSIDEILGFMPLAIANTIENDGVETYGIMLMALEGDNSPVDFTDKITGVDLYYKLDNDWVKFNNDYKYKKGEAIRFNISYQLEGGTLHDGNRIIEYQLSEKLELDQELSGPVYNDTGNIVGDYTVSATGLVQIMFRKNYYDDNNSGIAISGKFTVDAELGKDAVENDSIIIPFNSKININIPVDTDETSLTLSKTAGPVDLATGKVEYTIELSAGAAGTSNNVLLEDFMSGIALDGDISVNCTDNTYTINKNPDNRGFSVQFAKAMKPNAKYTVTYSAKLPEGFEASTTDVTADNTVRATTTKKDGEPIKEEKTAHVTYSQNFLSKGGSLSADKSVIEWTININDGKQNIGGWELNDSLNGVPLDKFPIVLTPSEGDPIVIDSLPYKFDGNESRSFTIVYTTPADLPLNENTVKNKVTLKEPNKDPIVAEHGVPIIESYNHYNPLSKSALSYNSNPDGSLNIDYRITINADKGGIAKGWVYTDNLDANQYFNSAQKKAIENTINALKSTYGNIGISWNYTGENCTGFVLTFENELPKGRVISFDYTATGILIDKENAQEFKNKGKINNIVESEGKITYYPLLQKHDDTWKNSPQTDHSLKDINGILKWRVIVSPPTDYTGGPLTITELLPEGVTLQKLELWESARNENKQITAQGDYIYNNDPTHNVNTKIDGQTVTVTIPEAFIKAAEVMRFELYIEVKINEGVLYDQSHNGTPAHFFTNVAEVSYGDVKASEQQTQIIKDESQKKEVLKKTAGQAVDNIVTYTVIINAEGKDLVADSDTLTVVDTATKYSYVQGDIRLVPGEVLVYNLNPDGSKGTELEKIEYPYTYVSREDASKNMLHILTLELPDERPLLLEYKYKAFKYPDVDKLYMQYENKIEIANAVEIPASGQPSQFDVVNSGALAETSGITVLKHDIRTDGIVLPGVVFELQRWDGNDKKFVKDPNKDRPDGNYITGSAGTFSMPKIIYNTAYQLVEITPYRGYIKPEEPYQFYIPHTDVATHPKCMPNNFKGEQLATSGLFSISNEKETTDIQVVKKWLDDKTKENITSNREGSIQFKLMRYALDEKPSASGNKCRVEWKGTWNNNLHFDKVYEVTRGSKFKISVNSTPTDWGGKADELTVNVNGTNYKMKQEGDSLTYSLEIVINEETLIDNVDTHYLIDTASFRETITEPLPQLLIPEDVPAADLPGFGSNIITISSDSNWRVVINGLPKTGEAPDGAGGTKTVYYTYYVEEITTGMTDLIGTPTYSDTQAGITTGTITITNTVDTEPKHELPQTGGGGTVPLAILGGGVMAITLILALIKSAGYKKRGKEDFSSS